MIRFQSKCRVRRSFLLANGFSDYSTRIDDGKGDKRSKMYAKFFRVLELDDGSSQDLVRRQYISLVKKYHPDSSQQNKEASMEKFMLIDEAYKKLQEKFLEDRRADEDCVGEYGLYYRNKAAPEDEDDGSQVQEHPDIKHTAPQHRQYLENEGFGYGTPGQRQRQYQRFRAARATESVYQHRVDKLTAKYEDRLVKQQERERGRRNVTQNSMERMVEDMISESMARGEFENLAGSGKPLPDRTASNPYMDFTSRKINEILVEGGFAPEWIMLKKDIQQETSKIRKILADKRRTLGPEPLTETEVKVWQEACQGLAEKEVKEVNRSIDRFNLVVPMLSGQMFHVDLAKEAEKVVREGVAKERRVSQKMCTF